jgi:hypothetical protein
MPVFAGLKVAPPAPPIGLQTHFGVRIMLITAVKSVLVTLAIMAFTAFGWVVLAAGQRAEQPKSGVPRKALAPEDGKDETQANLRRHLEAQLWALTKVDAENNTISARLYRFAEMDLFIDVAGLEGWFIDPTGQFNLDELSVRQGAKIVIDGKPASLKELRPRMRVSLRVGPGDGRVTQIEAASPDQGVLRATDVARNTITVFRDGKDLLLTPAPNAKYLVRGKEGQFTDLKAGMRVDLELGYQHGKILVMKIRAGK